MKVIGAGFGRTGTLSLKLALEQLGFAPCYTEEFPRSNDSGSFQERIAKRQEAGDAA